MPIDQAIRSQGIGASEIAAVCGLDPRQDSYGLWLRKRGLVSDPEPTPRMRAGKKVERVIAELYAEENNRDFIPSPMTPDPSSDKGFVAWIDTTQVNPDRPFQVYTPDAFCGDIRTPQIKYYFGLDCKNVAWDQQKHWGEPGTDDVPEHILTQCHWSMSASELERWDVAAFFGGWDLRVFTVRKDAEIERILLAHAEDWWRRHMIEGIEPDITASETAGRYLRERFPKNRLNLRLATEPEESMLENYSLAKREREKWTKETADWQTKLEHAIGEHDGLECARGKVTYKLCKDTVGTDWEGVAKDLLAVLANPLRDMNGNCIEEIRGNADSYLASIVANHQIVTKRGSRRFYDGLEEL